MTALALVPSNPHEASSLTLEDVSKRFHVREPKVGKRRGGFKRLTSWAEASLDQSRSVFATPQVDNLGWMVLGV